MTSASVYKLGNEPSWAEKAKDPKPGSYDHWQAFCGVQTDPLSGHDIGDERIVLRDRRPVVETSWRDNEPLYFRSSVGNLQVSSSSKRAHSTRKEQLAGGNKLVLSDVPTPIWNPCDQALLLWRFHRDPKGSIRLCTKDGRERAVGSVNRSELGLK